MRRWMTACCFLLASTLSFSTPLSQRPDVNAFINTMVKKHHFERAKLVTLFDHVKIRPKVIHAMKHAKEHLPWYRYRTIFLNPERITLGVNFWHRYKKTLAQAEKQYGVPAEIIVAIVGVESYYGARKGTYPLIDALTSFAFNYPSRQKFFTRALEEFLLFAREENLDPLSIKGSYAGAMGQPQFMPSSYRAYAVDFSHTGHRDLMDDEIDVIGSVANYLKQNGWKANQLVAMPATVSGSAYENLPKQGRKPTLSLNALAHYGIHPKEHTDAHQKALFYAFEGKGHPDFWLGFNNFYVITRYNTSPLYAMAVYQLGQAIKNARMIGLKHA